MRIRVVLFGLIVAWFSAGAAWANPVLMISIDGLRPADVLDAQHRGLSLPTLKQFVETGTHATGVRNMLPSFTYPNHTTLITGVSPAIHGISNNEPFDPLGKNMGGWYWYSSDIKVPTLWDAVHDAHKVVANVSWPVSVGNPSIDDNIPEYWRAGTPDDLKLLLALCTPGLIPALEQKAGIPAAAMAGEDPANDVARGRFTAAMIALKHPDFTTLHLISLDHYQHKYGPGSKEAHQALETIDGIVGDLVAAARKAEPDLIVAAVSDHGFVSITQDVNLMSAFAEAGLITVDPATGKITAWQAEPWNAGGSAAIVLAHPDDAKVKNKVAALLKKLAADPNSGIDQVIDKSQIEKDGGAKEASFWVDFKIGYEAGTNPSGPLLTPSAMRGTHGYFPSHPEMHATFLIDGPGIAKKNLGLIDMRDIAPTLAKLMGVSLPTAEGKPLF